MMMVVMTMMCACVLYVVSVCVQACVPEKPGEGRGSLGMGVTVVVKHPMSGWEPNVSTLEEHRALSPVILPANLGFILR